MSTETLDIATIKSRVNIVDVIGKYLSLKKKGAEHVAMCPFHNDHAASLTVNEKKQLWACFPCDKAGDALDFLLHKGRTMGEAIRELKEAAGEITYTKQADKWKPLTGGDDIAFEITHFKFGRPSKIWAYRDAKSLLNGFVCRFDFPDGSKETWPYTWCEDLETGRKEWRWHGFGIPRALYNLPALVKRPDDIVLVVEGEKTADAAQKLFPEFVCTTFQGGARAVSCSDWRPLSRRRIILWPDNDINQRYGKGDPREGQVKPWTEQPGNAAMLEVKQILWKDCPSMRWVRNIKTLPDKWDVADANWSIEEARQYLKSNLYNV